MISARVGKINPLDMAMKQADIVVERLKLGPGAAKGGIQGDLRNLFLHELEHMTYR